MKSVTINDKKFKIFITRDEIAVAVHDIAEKLNVNYAGKDVIFTGILNGSFMFFSDLLKQITLKSRVTFVKYNSYSGTESSGEVNELIGLNEDITGKTVIVVEDIVDSGLTIEKIRNNLLKHNPAGIVIVALLVKPGNFLKNIKVDYTGFEIPNDFIIGYGLDYNGYGRNFQDIFTLIH